MTLPLPLAATDLYILLVMHCIIGAIAAIVAQRKGLSLPRWILWGMVGGTVALITAVLAQPQSDQ